ncbi:hypothetical protein B0H17DRAFT_1207066 [Mycena rosella]|uniref:Uncharacterized protein n=1 Tax=Mycena rosella TaxID=1033263 RepID=A0AAD7G8H9_MYCRO|nr:hypothetical protein B0H17DRAFT_1207066 [Mycena rosella]
MTTAMMTIGTTSVIARANERKAAWREAQLQELKDAMEDAEKHKLAAETELAEAAARLAAAAEFGQGEADNELDVLDAVRAVYALHMPSCLTHAMSTTTRMNHPSFQIGMHQETAFGQTPLDVASDARTRHGGSHHTQIQPDTQRAPHASAHPNMTVFRAWTLPFGARPLFAVDPTRIRSNPRARTCVPVGSGLHLSKGTTNTVVFCLVFGLAPVHPLIRVLAKARHPEYKRISHLTFSSGPEDPRRLRGAPRIVEETGSGMTREDFVPTFPTDTKMSPTRRVSQSAPEIAHLQAACPETPAHSLVVACMRLVNAPLCVYAKKHRMALVQSHRPRLYRIMQTRCIWPYRQVQLWTLPPPAYRPHRLPCFQYGPLAFALSTE